MPDSTEVITAITIGHPQQIMSENYNVSAPTTDPPVQRILEQIMTDTPLPLLLEPSQLPETLDPAHFRLVDMSRSEQYLAGHIPGAVHLPPGSLTSPAPRPGLLPDIQSLKQILGSLGHHQDLHYIVYDDEGGGWAGRFIWLLDSVGHTRYSYLNGGLVAWHDEGLPMEQDIQQVEPTQPSLD